jgi:C4-dicarboxylate-specific signal transduction histidine kinase
MGAVHPDDREAVKLALSRSLSNDRDLEMEYRVQTASAAAQWISVRGRIERDSAGKPMLMRGVVLDISTRRRSELELQHLQSQLAHTSRVSMLGQLATALAHELHQPLGAILRNAEAAELFLGHDPIDFGEIRAILMDIRADDQRAREVIDRLRALLKRGTIDPRSLAVPDLLTKIASLTRAEALTRGITVEVDTRSELPSVIGDAVHVQQVLLNLVLNAMDAIEGADSAERLIVVRAQPHEGGQVEVLVSDTGPGIPEDKMAQIFEPFFTTKASGMGIGLSVSRTIIEAHGGRLWAESKADRGAIFRFTLPIEEMAVS